MDALIAKADAIQPLSKKRKIHHSAAGSSKSRPSSSKAASSSSSIKTADSILKNTSLPKSLAHKSSADATSKIPTHKHIANKKLRSELVRTSAHLAQSQQLLAEAADFLPSADSGFIQTDPSASLERTWRVSQSDVAQAAGGEAAKGRREWRLDGGPYRSRYTRNGRFIAIAGKNGHVASLDWMTGQVLSELQLGETTRDITYLQDQSFFAVAQKKYVYIYDKDGVEVHCLKAHIEPTRLEFLPYHWLLASIGNAGHLKYQDTSTGQLVGQHRTKLGASNAMTQNIHNAVIHLGHGNGQVTLWTPNLPHPAVTLLAHLGPVSSISMDPNSGGRYMATAGKDGTVKVWDCRNWKGAIREWSPRSSGGSGPELEWSQRGALAVGSGGSVNLYTVPSIHTPMHGSAQPPLYLTHPLPSSAARPITSLRFAPFTDVLTIGHAHGLSSILVPGSGDPTPDSTDTAGLNPYENVKARREREVRALLDKVQPDMISLDPEFVGTLDIQSAESGTKTHDGKVIATSKNATPFARLSRAERLRVQGKADDTEIGDEDGDAEGDEEDDESGERKGKKDREEREKRKMRGKGKSLKRYLRKQRKNVVDPAAVAIRAKLAKQNEERRAARRQAAGLDDGKKSALDRFKRD